MVTPISARDALLDRLRAVFSDGRFEDAFPELDVPGVYMGFPTTEPPFYVAVDEMPSDMATSASDSGLGMKETFVLGVWVLAVKSDLIAATNDAVSYANVVAASVIADRTLGRTIDRCAVACEQAGTGRTNDGYYVAAIRVNVSCEKQSRCPGTVIEIIKEANL